MPWNAIETYQKASLINVIEKDVIRGYINPKTFHKWRNLISEWDWHPSDATFK
jgi:hypothetical protein